MIDYELSEHAAHVLRERDIAEAWVTMTIENPDRIEKRTDGTVHHLRRIHEYENRVLRVIVNPNAVPRRVVTAFFDRRLRDL